MESSDQVCERFLAATRALSSCMSLTERLTPKLSQETLHPKRMSGKTRTSNGHRWQPRHMSTGHRWRPRHTSAGHRWRPRHTSAGHRCRPRHTSAGHRWRPRHTSAGHRCRLRHTSAGHRWRTTHIRQPSYWRTIHKPFRRPPAVRFRIGPRIGPRILRESVRERFLAATRTLFSCMSLTEEPTPFLSL